MFYDWRYKVNAANGIEGDILYENKRKEEDCVRISGEGGDNNDGKNNTDSSIQEAVPIEVSSQYGEDLGIPVSEHSTLPLFAEASTLTLPLFADEDDQEGAVGIYPTPTTALSYASVLGNVLDPDLPSQPTDNKVDSMDIQAAALYSTPESTELPFDQFRLRFYNVTTKTLTDAFEMTTNGWKTLESLSFNSYRPLTVELKQSEKMWEIYYNDGLSVQLEGYDEATNSLLPVRSIRLPKYCTVGKRL